MSNDKQEHLPESEVDERDEQLTVEIPTDIKAGRSSSDCYSCYVLA